jgi:general secretion pathway protein D
VPAVPAPTPAPAAVPALPAPVPAPAPVQDEPAVSPTSKISLTLSMPASVQLNEQFTAQVNAAEVQSLYNAVFKLTYDPGKLEVVSQSEGTLMKQDGLPASFQAFADKKKGELWVSQLKQDAPKGVSGSGTIASVIFKAIGKGAAGIGFANTNFKTKSGAQLTVTPFKSVVEVK